MRAPLASPPPALGLSRRELTVSLLSLSGLALVGCDPASDKGAVGDTGPVDTEPVDTGPVAWATGGTASMSGDYADPFEAETGATCDLMCEMTLGPCYAETPERKDVSEGITGLPTRLALRLLDTRCQPVAGALVEIWHTAPNGLYSGEEAAAMCTTGDAEAVASHWFRGGQVSDAAGRVDFDTCFPGWYTSRTIHIHLRVVVGGEEYLVSQLYFEQALIDEIFTVHPEYSGYGLPAVDNSEDGLLSSADPAPYTVATSKLPDGALMAFKTIVIRGALSEAPCEAGGPG